MAENASGMKKRTSAELLAPARRSLTGRIRKPNSRIFGADDEEYPITPKPRKHLKVASVKGSAAATVSLNTPDKRAAQQTGVRLRNLLKLPKAHVWVCYEWFYSNVDRALFEGENDFSICLKESLPQLKTRQLTRVQWCKVRRLMGKPRRCSSAFFAEERAALARKRQKIRSLQQRKIASAGDFKDLPAEIPMSLVIGTRVTARLRKPQDGLFDGVIDALNPVTNTYRITFDRPGLGTHSVLDIDVLSVSSYETMPLTSFQVRSRPMRHNLFTPPRQRPSSPNLENDPLLGGSPGRGGGLMQIGDTLGGFPLKFLSTVTRLTKLLGVKKDLIRQIKSMNTEAEKLKSYGKDLGMPFQQQYATLILELDQLNKELNHCLGDVQHCCHELDPDQALSNLDQPNEIRKKCQAEAEAIVKKTNNAQSKKRVKNERNLQLIGQLMSLLLQIRTFADSEMHSFEFKSLQESLDEIKSSLDPSNLSVFRNSVEIHINHIQNGLTQTGNLQAFAASSQPAAVPISF